MKMRILMVVMLVASIAMFSTGAFAYFSSQQSLATSTITTGKLELQIADGTGMGECSAAAYGNTAAGWNFANMVPGETIEKTICLKNNGTVDMGRVWYDWSGLTETPAGKDFADQLIIVDIRDNLDGSNQAAALKAIAGIETLADLAAMNNAVDISGGVNDAWSATSVYPYIQAQQTGWMYMKLKFAETADNTFQGTSLVFNTTINATQKTADNK